MIQYLSICNVNTVMMRVPAMYWYRDRLTLSYPYQNK